MYGYENEQEGVFLSDQMEVNKEKEKKIGPGHCLDMEVKEKWSLKRTEMCTCYVCFLKKK